MDGDGKPAKNGVRVTAAVSAATASVIAAWHWQEQIDALPPEDPIEPPWPVVGAVILLATALTAYAIFVVVTT